MLDIYEIVEVVTPEILRDRYSELFRPEQGRWVADEDPGVPPAGSYSRRSPVPADQPPARIDFGDAFLDIPAFLRKDAREPLGPPPWAIGFSKQFKKDTAGLDRKLLGRVLEVLEEISGYTTPFRAHGDTFKPLTGPLEGCWRYRLGDHRLVIQPLQRLSQINALTLGARGSVYD